MCASDTSQGLPDTNWYGTSYRYSSSQRNSKLKHYGSAGFQVYQDGEEDGSGDAAAGGAGRLFSPPLCSRCCIAFSNSFW
jgi:hypothetical protein